MIKINTGVGRGYVAQVGHVLQMNLYGVINAACWQGLMSQVHESDDSTRALLIDARKALITFDGTQAATNVRNRRIATVCLSQQLIQFAVVSGRLADDGNVRRNFISMPEAYEWTKLKGPHYEPPWMSDLQEEPLQRQLQP